jgi:hypothetical protein
MHLSRRKSLLSCARKNSSNADDWANHDGDAIFAAVPSTIAQARRDGGPGRFFPGRVRARKLAGHRKTIAVCLILEVAEIASRSTWRLEKPDAARMPCLVA